MSAESFDLSLNALRASLFSDFATLRKRVDAWQQDTAPTEDFSPESGLRTIAEIFGLPAAAIEILGLAAACELDPSSAEQMTSMTGGERPTVELMLSLCPESGWDALSPESALRRWRLVEPVGATTIARQRLATDERMLQYLMGVNYVDARLAGLATLVTPSRQLSDAENDVADMMTSTWRSKGLETVVLLTGSDLHANREVAVTAASSVGQRLLRVSADDLAEDWSQRYGLATFLDREMALSNSILVVESDATTADRAAKLVDGLIGPCVLSSADPPKPNRGPRLRVSVVAPDSAERRHLWSAALAESGEDLEQLSIDRLAEQFTLDRSEIDLALDRASSDVASLWTAAREQSRTRLDGMAERVDTSAGWDDLVLPADQLQQLRDLALQVGESWRVHRDWGWATKGSRGLGAAALFAGPSGTGKTLAAEVVAVELGLDLYRVDLSQVVSKWIGETEKNLARIFRAAEVGGAILLFDEADALFGKRSEVKDSHDRYANVEVSYLLQRMESYRGLAILTTNMRSSLDRAFLRRLRFIINFPFPDAAARTQIWEQVFPESTPTTGLDFEALGRLNIAGGSIRSIALNACFLAAGAGDEVRPAHVLAATQREFSKLEKPLSNAEIRALS